MYFVELSRLLRRARVVCVFVGDSGTCRPVDSRGAVYAVLYASKRRARAGSTHTRPINFNQQLLVVHSLVAVHMVASKPLVFPPGVPILPYTTQLPPVCVFDESHVSLHPPPPCPRSMDYIFENNRKWVKESVEEDPESFTKFAKSQQPKYLYIGCSDSRVPAQNMMVRGWTFSGLVMSASRASRRTNNQVRAGILQGWTPSCDNHAQVAAQVLRGAARIGTSRTKLKHVQYSSYI